LYHETRDPAALALAWRATRALPDTANIHGGYRAAISGALHDLEGDRSGAMRDLRLGIERLRACEADLNALYVERRLQELAGDGAGVARVDQALREQGVQNPMRWVWTNVPSEIG
jgi:hypothetical protein